MPSTRLPDALPLVRYPALRALAAAALLAAGLDPRSLAAQRGARAAHASTRNAVSAAPSVDPGLFAGMRWRMIGPGRGGRVTTVTGIPAQPQTFYMGSTGGGVWKTTDAGRSWRNVSDGFFAAASMGAVEVAPSNPDVVWAGTGSDGIRSNVSIGRGVYRSTDGGKTWTFAGLRDVGQIGGVRAHPTNPDVAWVAALGNPFARNPERGVYKTTDGGRTWRRTLFVSDSTGAIDVELQPGNPDVLYASMWRGERKPWTIISGAHEGGIYRSADGGETWTKLTRGLPSGLFGKSNVAVSAADPRRVYALIEAAPGSGLYRSDDGGDTWALANGEARLITRPFYYDNITADPTNADVVYIGNEGFFKSTDGGKTFRTLPTPHGDNHDLWINPRDGRIMIQSNDGGANVTEDGGRSWSTQMNQPTAEIYQVYVDNQFPYRVYGAQQDNTTVIVPSLPLSSTPTDEPSQTWRQGPGCETGPIIPHLTQPDTVYGACKGQFSRLSLRTGQEKQYWIGAQSLYGNAGKDLAYRFQRVSPMEVSPHDPLVVYFGSQYLHRTTDEGVTWERISPDLTANDPRYAATVAGEPITIDVTGEEYYSTLYAIRESGLEPGVIWTGANDGPVHVTRDNGRTWTDVTPRGLAPGGRVQNIEPSPHRRGSAYVAVLRYLLGDFRPYIYRTDDYGQSWTLLTDGRNGIPADVPTRVVREDPERQGLLYAGTEFGTYVSFDDGGRWQPLQLNLPVTPVTDMKVTHGDLVASTQGRAFWILSDLSPLRQAADSVGAAPAHLYTPARAVRMRYSNGFGGAERALERPDAPQYPEPGAVIDYTLGAAAADGPVTLDVLDAAGRVIRSFSADSAGSAPMPAERAGTPRLERGTGMHRFTWDLALPGAWDASLRRSGRDGPMVAPGTYAVRLTAGGWSATRPLTVVEDPRVAADGVTQADLEALLAHNLRVRDLVSDANRAAAVLQAARRRLPGATGAAADTLARVNALADRLLTPPIRYSKPGLQAHVQYLYGLTAGADQRVGRDAAERYATLRRELDGLLADLRAALGPNILDTAVSTAGAAAARPTADDEDSEESEES
ncbi:MAG: hypothetical protein JWM27_4993 [Gemmatimonadetes bacterium]|nr:hypothetical protein [Gemmatimonadota bacterium]